MILRCRNCGKDNTVDVNVSEYSCTWCGGRFQLKLNRTEEHVSYEVRGAKPVDREPVAPSDPLGDFR